MSVTIATILDCLERGEPLVQAVVVSTPRYSPRHSGFRMLISNNGESKGSLGGGGVENLVKALAREMPPHASARLIEYELETSASVEPGEADVGRMFILMEMLRPSPQTMGLYRTLSSGAHGKRFSISIYLGKPKQMARVAGLLAEDAEEGLRLLERSGFPEAGDWLDKVFDEASENRRPVLFRLEGPHQWRFLIEPLAARKTVYVFGAEGVGSEVAKLAGGNGFDVVLLDDRPEIANQENRPGREVRLVRDLSAAVRDLLIDCDCFLVIATRGHEHDQNLLKDALETEAGYIGMLGSTKKRDTAYGNLVRMGVDKKRLKDVHCPIGLDIGAETPSEIAVSIVAEMIRERSRQGPNGRMQ